VKCSSGKLATTDWAKECNGKKLNAIYSFPFQLLIRSEFELGMHRLEIRCAGQRPTLGFLWTVVLFEQSIHIILVSKIWKLWSGKEHH
jgi:hypothetical protein